MQDMLASEMFQLISREADLAQTVVQYVKLQRAYHQSALKMLEEKIPELEKNISKFLLVTISMCAECMASVG